jgi:hypothetical protein
MIQQKYFLEFPYLDVEIQIDMFDFLELIVQSKQQQQKFFNKKINSSLLVVQDSIIFLKQLKYIHQLLLNVQEKHLIHIPNIIYRYNSYQDL